MARVDSKHPDYVEYVPDWDRVRDVDRGEKRIKEEGVKYLPMPSGFTTQADGGAAMYEAYKTRAEFLTVLGPMVRGMVGLIHRKEPQIIMPDSMIDLWEKATPDGLPLESFHRRITEELLKPGRYAILVDIPREGADLPYMAGYRSESVINWSDTQDFFVLDETTLKRDRFEWNQDIRYRELVIEDGRYVQRVHHSLDDGDGEEIPIEPRGRDSLDFIPLVVGNTDDLSTKLIEPPLLGVANSVIAAYQLSADYRHQLYMSGQETLVVRGLDVNKLPRVVGAGASIGLGENPNAEAYYIGPSGVGIEAHERAIRQAAENAVSAGLRLFDKHSGQESGEALRLRYSAQTASITSIAITSAKMLETALRYIAIIMGLKPDSVTVVPNLRFVETIMNPVDAEALMRLWLGGAISKRTLYENFQRGEIASEERSFEKEEELIESEPIDEPIVVGGNPIKEETVV